MKISFSVFLVLILFHTDSYARNWRVTPSFTLSELYSDNVTLASSGKEKSAFVTEFSPGISARWKTKRNNFNLDYRMQNLQNAGGSNKFEIFHQLKFDSVSELIKNSFFLDLNSNIGQQNITNQTIANDNLSANGNRTDVITYRVSPYWTPHLNGYADGEVRFSYNKLMLDNNANASDTEDFDYFVRLNSGRRFSRVTWFVDHATENQKRDIDNNDVTFQKTLAEVRGHFNRHFNVFGQIGYSDNSFLERTDENKNGFFYSVGAKWKPSERFILEAAGGNNLFVTVNVMPTRRMNWKTTYRNNDIGTNTGSIWETRLDYRTKRSIWAASYFEDTTTVQRALNDIQNFIVEDEFGNPVVDPVTQQIVQADIGLPNLVDEVFIRKRGEFSVSYEKGKTKLNALFFSERRTFQESNARNDVIGISGSWDWKYARHTTFSIRPSWLHTTREGSKDNRYDISIGVSRQIPMTFGRRWGRLFAQAHYRHINQSSDLLDNEYQENRIAAQLLLTL